MGRRGTDFAKEVAGIVLADDRFATIGEAVREGRVIGDNVRRFIAYLAACNVAEVLVLLVPALVLAPPLLLPLQILWLNLVTDTFPALALALEPAANDVMHRPPASLFRLLDDASWRAVGIGALLLAGGTAAAYGLAHALLPGGGHALAATVCFETLALAQLAYAFAMRRIRGTPSGSNPALTVAVLATAVVQVALPVLESTRRVFDLAPLSLAAWAIVALCALAPASLVLLYQAVRRRAGASTVEVSA
jgi:Ca2+-transporting ATPase